MRDLKFRRAHFFDENKTKFRNFTEWGVGLNGTSFTSPAHTNYAIYFDDLQFTGLKDKNGKGNELYHKDLIINYSRNNGNPHVIEWSDKSGGWIGSYKGLEYLIAQELNQIEKVGNFFQHKELLK